MIFCCVRCILPYFGKRKQVTYHPNLSYWCFHISPNVLFFLAKCYAETLILLRDMLGKTSWYSIDISVNDRHVLLFYKKCHFCHLLPFAKVGQYTCTVETWYKGIWYNKQIYPIPMNKMFCFVLFLTTDITKYLI